VIEMRQEGVASIMYSYLFSAFISFALTAYFKPNIITMLENHRFISKNYSGKAIINGGGLIFLYPCLFGILPFWNDKSKIDLLIYISIIFSSLLSGFIDDFLGENQTKGFRGHINMLLSGRLTTGVLKIFIGIAIGFIASVVHYSDIWDIGFHTILFALTMNIINLLDLRPGRAIKGFLITVTLIMIFTGLNELWLLLPVITAMIIYIPGEMKEKYMMGDTGSNLLGGILGLYVIRISQINVKLIVFFALVLLHVFGEFYSISKIIDAIPILRSIDDIGRIKKER